MKTHIAVTQNADAPITGEVLAESITAISQGVKRLLAGPLNETALLLLIAHAAPKISRGYPKAKTAPTIKEIKATIEGIESLERAYLKPKKPAVH